MRHDGLQMAISALPALTYLNVRFASVLEITIFAASWRILERIVR
jgi:hypothetical protein